jgi:hypothetical protein
LKENIRPIKQSSLAPIYKTRSNLVMLEPRVPEGKERGKNEEIMTRWAWWHTRNPSTWEAEAGVS